MDVTAYAASVEACTGWTSSHGKRQAKRGGSFPEGFFREGNGGKLGPMVGSWDPFQLENQLKLARIDGMRLLMFAVMYLHE